MLADTDVGNVVVAAQSGAHWGYRLLFLPFVLIPVLFMMQELTVRLGIYTGRGYGELVLEKFGARWSLIVAGGLIVGTVSTMVTEFTGIAGIGEMYGVPRSLTLPIAVAVVLGMMSMGSYRKVERLTLMIGLFELAFVYVAWIAHPNLKVITQQSVDLPIHSQDFAYCVAALIGTAFNPWMIFYQQSAVVDRKLQSQDHRAARWDTAIGAVLTQMLTAAILVAVASTTNGRAIVGSLATIGDISRVMFSATDSGGGRLIFCIGLFGAAIAGAAVSSLAIAWGIGEIAGYRRSLDCSPFKAPWFYGLLFTCVTGSSLMVWIAPNLVALTIQAQAINALLLPIFLLFLILLATRSLPEEQRLRGIYLLTCAVLSSVVCLAGIFSEISGLLSTCIALI